MTNAELLAKIKAEIERQMKFYDDKEMKAWDDSEQGDEDALWYRGHRNMCAKLLSFISTLESEKPVPNYLEEAAEKHSTEYDSVIWDVLESSNQKTIWKKEHKETFIAGAKWDREQMMKDGNVILAEEDFDAEKEKSMEWGYNLCKEQIMKEAVECETVCIKDRLLAVLPMKEFRWTVGDKVRIIIVKDNN